MISSSNVIVNWVEKRGKVPVYKKGYLPDVDDLYQSSDDSIDDAAREAGVELELEKFSSKGLFEIDIQDLEDTFIKDVKADIDLLEAIHKKWFESPEITSDPKIATFKKNTVSGCQTDSTKITQWYGDH